MANDDNSASMEMVFEQLRAFNDKMQQQSKWIDQPNHPELPAIIDRYVKRDFWLLPEALNILRGYHPYRTGWGNTGDRELAQSCVGPGGSLNVINTQESVRHWKVRPKDFVQWANQKGLPIDSILKLAVQGEVKQSLPISTGKTDQANLSRKSEKEARLQAIKRIRDEIDRRVAEQNRNWDSRNIPATKADLHDIFFQINPDLKKVTVETLSDDLPQIGIKFQPGQKPNKDNVLARLLVDFIQGD
ncbi:MAG: hypothetical protein JAY97_17135 [Candidatus Thiodiazotropha sp. 'RUGA']|nr:hypothetical protein [Candidatus Thiodiazotropha sp. 'RUGA']